MSWKRFKEVLDEILHPPYLRDMTPEERALRRRQHDRNSELSFPLLAFASRADDESTEAQRRGQMERERDDAEQ
jgi:hypothetical protein